MTIDNMPSDEQLPALPEPAIPAVYQGLGQSCQAFFTADHMRAAQREAFGLGAAQGQREPVVLTEAQKDRYKYMSNVAERLQFEAWKKDIDEPIQLCGDGSYDGTLFAQHDWYV